VLTEKGEERLQGRESVTVKFITSEMASVLVNKDSRGPLNLVSGDILDVTFRNGEPVTLEWTGVLIPYHKTEKVMVEVPAEPLITRIRRALSKALDPDPMSKFDR
jgi:hypothetical protein